MAGEILRKNNPNQIALKTRNIVREDWAARGCFSCIEVSVKSPKKAQTMSPNSRYRIWMMITLYPTGVSEYGHKVWKKSNIFK